MGYYQSNSLSSSSPSKYAIEIEALTKSFWHAEKQKTVLKEISLKIEKNQIFGILGPNGAGKTTLIYMLSGLLHADSGAAKVLGFDPKRQRVALAKRINICSGNSMFFYAFTAREILKYYGLLYGMSERKIDENSIRLIADLGMAPFAEKQFQELSTGMKQKVALAKSLINEPELLFLDEPTLGLDVEIAKNIRHYVAHLVKTKNMTVILTSHYLFEVEELCSNIAVIHQGRIVANGTVDSIKQVANVESTIIAEFGESENKDMGFIRKIPGVKNASISGNKAAIYIEGGAECVESVIAAFKNKKIKLNDIAVRKATLEEAFLRLVNCAE